MINYCCSRCDAKTPKVHARKIEITELHEGFSSRHTYVLCAKCAIELEDVFIKENQNG